MNSPDAFADWLPTGNDRNNDHVGLGRSVQAALPSWGLSALEAERATRYVVFPF